MTSVIHPERVSAYARGDLAERMVGEAAELAFMVRDEDRDGIAAWLDQHGVPDDLGTRALIITLAAMVSIDATPDEMLSWIGWDEFGCPLPGAGHAPAGPAPLAVPDRFYEDCGTPKAYSRHKRAGHSQAEVEACGCGQAYRDYHNARYAARHGGQVAAVSRKTQTAVKVAEYARLTRTEGMKKADAAERLGISLRTAERYEAKLKAAGEASRAA